MVHIYFGTATFDLMERDTKIKMENQLSVIGGTMGLFTGFSILSAVEIVYFTVKHFMSLRIKKIMFKENTLLVLASTVLVSILSLLSIFILFIIVTVASDKISKLVEV